MASPPTLYIIDGYAQFFRAYHAIRTPMSSPVTKEPTNMTFGFVGMLLKLLRGRGNIGGRPDYVLVTLDVSGDRGTFRSELYPDYKAHRPPAPENLEPQVDRVLDTLKKMKVPILGAAGYEADDVIATVVRHVQKERPDLRVRIVSKDKDLKQLLCGGRQEGEGDSHQSVEASRPQRNAESPQAPGSGGPTGCLDASMSPASPVELYDVHNDELITEATLREETGLRPPQVIDYLALMGDTVDNVPGVEGVGPKTAAQLIAEYGSLEGVVEEAMKEKSAIKGKRLENIRAAAPKLPLSRELVTLRTDAPVEIDLAAAEVKGFDLGALGPVLRELGFNRYQDELRALMGAPVSGAGSVDAIAGRLSPGQARLVESVADDRPAKGRGRTAPDAGFGGLFDNVETTPAAAAATRIMPQSGEYRAITTPKELRELVEELRAAPVISIDTETTGLQPLRDVLAGVCLSTKAGTGVYIPVRSPTPKEHMTEAMVLETLRPILEDAAKPKCGHNLKFDMLVLRRAGVKLAGFMPPLTGPAAGASWTVDGEGDLTAQPRHIVASPLPTATVFDSMVASYLIDAERSSHGLDSLALALLGRTNISITQLIGTGRDQRTFDQVPIDQATQYAAEDADVALQLREVMLPQLRAMGLLPLFERVEMPLVEVLAELEWNGIRVDRAELDRQRQRLQGRIDALRVQIVTYAEEKLHRPFNPDSPKQLAAVLFNKPTAPDEEGGPGFGIKPLKKIKTGYSTDAEVLEKLAEDPTIDNPIPGLVVEHRELTKLVNTYLEALADAIYPDDPAVIGRGRIHASFNQTVAATGRLSASDPNLQNIPIRTDIGREIRRAFVAEPGYTLVSADYSQIELRLLAHLSKDPALLEAFRQGQDVHTAVAAQIFGVPLDKVGREQRNAAKMVNFGIVYGVTNYGLARRLGVPTSQAEEIITGYKRRFAGITTFLQECIDQAQRMGYVQTMLGRRRPIPDIFSGNPSRRGFGERAAINSVVQGSAADLIKLAMVELHARITGAIAPGGAAGGKRAAPVPSSLCMLLQIHDELVFECRREDAAAAERIVCEVMEGAMELSVPLRVDVRHAENWFEGK